MMKVGNLGFREDFRRFFVRGLATLLPTILTIVVLVKCYEFIQQNISVHIIEGIIRVVLVAHDDYPIDKVTPEDINSYKNEKALAEGYPELTLQERYNYLEENNLPSDQLFDEKMTEDIRNWKLLSDSETHRDIRHWKLQQDWSHGPRALIGFFIAIIVVYLLGRLLGSFLGRKLWRMFEGTVQQVPGFKQVYPFVKQVTEFLIGEKKLEFSRVVAVPYPRKDIWSVGLVTGAGFRRVKEETKEELLTIFIPSSPTPVTGYVIYVKKEEVIDLPITIEEALRFTASAGVIVPDHQALPSHLDKLIKGPLAPQLEGRLEEDQASEQKPKVE